MLASATASGTTLRTASSESRTASVSVVTSERPTQSGVTPPSAAARLDLRKAWAAGTASVGGAAGKSISRSTPAASRLTLSSPERVWKDSGSGTLWMVTSAWAAARVAWPHRSTSWVGVHQRKA